MNKSMMMALGLLVAPVVMAGGDSMAVLQVRNLSKASADLAALAEAVQLPMPPGLLEGQLGMSIMSPELTGVDTSRPITVFLGAVGGEEAAPQEMALSFAVTGDGAEYLDAIAQMMPERTEVEPGLHRFSMQVPDGMEAPSFYVRIEDGLALFGQDPAVMQRLGDDLDADERAVFAALPGEVSVSINVRSLTKLLNDQIRAQQELLASLPETSESGEAEEAMDRAEREAAASLDAMGSMFARAMDQFDLLVVNFDASRDFTVRTHLRPVSGSLVAQMVDGMSTPPPLYSGYRDPQAWITSYGTMAGFDRILEPYAEWVASLYRGMGPPMDAFAESYKSMLLGMKGVYSGGYSFVVLPPKTDNPLQFGGLYEIAGKEQARDNLRAMMAMQVKQMEGMSEELPVTFSITTQAEEPYQGVEIDSYIMNYGFGKEDGAFPMPASLAGLFSNMVYRVGYMDQALVYSFGSLETLHQLIDYVSSGGATEPSRDGFSDVTEDALGYFNLSVAGLISSLSTLMPPELGGNALTSLKDVEASIRALTIKEHGGVSTLLRLTKEDLAGFMQIGMAFAPQAQPGMDPEGEPMMMDDLPSDEEAPSEVE